MMEPPLRVVPPSYAQLAAGEDALHVAWFREEPAELARLAAAVGLDATMTQDGTRVAGSWRELDLLARTLASEVHPAARRLRRYLDPVAGWRLRTRTLPLDHPIVMGIVNLTTDSFSGDGVGVSPEGAAARAEELRSAGAAIIDVGAESARADRPVMDEGEEAELVSGCAAELAAAGHVVSVDTYKPGVAAAALERGAELVNDISGLTQGTGAAEAALHAGAGYVLNYSYSVPKRRPDAPPQYSDVVQDTISWMFERVDVLRGLGFDDDRVAIDPGIAFGKSHDEDLQVLRRIGELRTPGLPVLLAHSRKNFIGSVSGMEPAARDLETHVVTTLAYAQGIRIFRVHDAAGAARAAEMAAAVVDRDAGAFAPDGESWPWRAGADGGHMMVADPDRDAPPGQRW